MRLAAFLVQDIDGIVAEWEAFAATQLPAAQAMAPLELRDHAREILQAIAPDLETSQTRLQQSDKSKGQVPTVVGAPQTAAQIHAVLRARSGFDINQLVGEYRALRASVLRRWLDAVGADGAALEDVIRFNEAIDQAVAESVGHFHGQVERARNLLLGMLGHDMRSPLNSILLTASYLARLSAGDEVTAAALRLIRSGASMQALLDDLVDFNRTRLGLGIRVMRSEVDLSQVLSSEVEQLRSAHPDRRINASIPDGIRGKWDGARLQQVLRNLVSNAVRYGTPREPILVSVRSDAAALFVDVTNAGPPIPRGELDELFEPLKRGQAAVQASHSDNGLGLGLFIVREIVNAHGGEVAVVSEKGHTTFSVHLPR